MKYKTIIETDDFENFKFFEDGNGKYMQGIDAGAENKEWIILYFTECKQEPNNDMVSRGVFEQVMWERDVAIEQLKDLGYGLGEKPKTGRWIKTGDYYIGAYGSIDYVKCSSCGEDSLEEGDFCPNCGARMVGDNNE